MMDFNRWKSYQREIMEPVEFQRQTAWVQTLALPLTRYVTSFANYFMFPSVPLCKVGMIIVIAICIELISIVNELLCIKLLLWHLTTRKQLLNCSY